MADSLQFYRGKEDALPALKPGEPGYCTDTKRLYIGTAMTGNVLIAENATLAKVDDILLDIISLEEDVDEINALLTAQGATLSGLSATVTTQGNALDGLSQTVTSQGSALDGLSKTVASQGTALSGKLSASPVASQAAVAAEAELADVITALNALITAMKASGVMN